MNEPSMDQKIPGQGTAIDLAQRGGQSDAQGGETSKTISGQSCFLTQSQDVLPHRCSIFADAKCFEQRREGGSGRKTGSLQQQH